MGQTRNLPAKKYSSGERTEKTIRFAFSSNSDVYIDLSKALGEVNRRSYRQGLYYYIQSVELQDATDGSTVDIYTIADNWLTKQAWIRGYQHWNRINERSEAPLSKYADFKIRMTQSGASATFAVPEGHGSADEYALSNFLYNKTAETGGMGSAAVYMCGTHDGAFPNVNGYGLINGYHKSRRNAGDIQTAVDPAADTISQDILVLDGSDGHPEITDAKVSENDLTPYDHDNAFGFSTSDLTRQYRLSTGSGAGRATTIPGFCVPFGLMKLDPACDGEWSLTVKLAPGPYHGVYAERVFDEQ
jgi:hypothetical protein